LNGQVISLAPVRWEAVKRPKRLVNPESSLFKESLLAVFDEQVVRQDEGTVSL
jgi:hypothetical protein